MSCLNAEPPENFQSTLSVVACYVMWKDEILLLLRHSERYEGSKYGPPAGKILEGEELQHAMIRELSEESGISITDKELSFIRTYFVRYPTFDYDYHVFLTRLSKEPVVRLNPREHVGFKWVTPAETLNLPLVAGEDESIRLTFGIQ